jgi:phage terminase large subunit-like protein
MTHSEKAEAYARDVVEGRILASKWTRLACKRHLADLDRQESDGFPYRFDAEEADRVCRLKETFQHVKGRWARERQMLELEPWQCFVTCSIFGWVRVADGTRRFRKASIYVPRKNGKSFEAAATGNVMFFADGEPGAEVYSGASTEKQAWEVFGPARQMMKRDPEFCAQLGVEVGAKAMFRPSDGSKFEPVIGKPGDGPAPHCWIVDEYHEHQTADQYDTAITGMGSREQPLMFVISTAGDDIEGPCYDDWRTVQRILEGSIVDEEHFGIIWTCDEDVDWTSPEAIEMANPNIGVSVSREFLLARQREAVQNARHQYRFKIKHLNQWVTSRSAFYNVESWRGLGEDGLSLDDFAGRDCFVGLDLASKVDVAALVLVFPGEDGYDVLFRFYVPEDRLEEAEGERYRLWAANGWITLTDGNVISLQRIQDDIEELAARVNVLGAAYDPWQATQLATNLQEKGLPMVEWRQTVMMMSEPMKESEALIKSGRIRHDGNPLMTWMMGNVVAKYDAKENVYPRKERSQDKIDGPVGMIMALGLAMRQLPAQENSGWLL